MGFWTSLRKNLKWMTKTKVGNWAYHFFTDNWEQRWKWIGNKLASDSGSGTDTDVSESPAISGAKNSEGTDKVIPLVLGKHILTPYYCGKPYHSIDDEYGETQTYHALFNLGYRNTSVSKIRLGWIDLSSGDSSTGTVPYSGFGSSQSLSGEYFTDSVNTKFLLKLLQNIKTTSLSVVSCGESTDFVTDMSIVKPTYSNGKISVGSYSFKYYDTEYYEGSSRRSSGYFVKNQKQLTYSKVIPATFYIPLPTIKGTVTINITGDVNLVLGEITTNYFKKTVHCNDPDMSADNCIEMKIPDVFDCSGTNDSKYSLTKTVKNSDGTTDLTITYDGYVKIQINSTYYKLLPITFLADTQINSVTINKTEPILGDLAIDGRWSASDYNIKLNLQSGEENPLYTQKVVEEELNVELTHLNDDDDTTGAGILLSERFSAKNPMKTEIEFDIAGLFRVDSDGNKHETAIQLCIQYSLDGGTTWKNYGCPYSSKGVWKTVATGKSATVHGMTLTGLDVYEININRNKEMRFVASRTYTYDEAMNASDRIIEFRIFRYNKNGAKADGTSTDTYTDTATLTYIRTWCYDFEKSKGTYDVATKTYQYWNSTTSKWSGGTLVSQTPMSEKKRKITSTLGFQVDADSNEFKNQLNELNCIIQSRGRTCQKVEEKDSDGYVTGYHYEWSSSDELSPTSNPASLVLMLMQHESREKYAYTDDDFDLQSFGALYEFCSTAREEFGKVYPKFACNGVLTSQTKTLTVVNDILSVCRAKLKYENNKFSVFMDNPETENTLVLNNRNILSFSVKKPFGDEFDGVKVSFENEDNNYEKDEMKVLYNDRDAYDEDKADKLVYNSLELKYQTSPSQIYQNAKYYLATQKLHPETWEVKTSVDAHLLKMGSRVGVQSDTISAGIGDGGEVKGFSYNDDKKIRYILTDCNIDSTVYDVPEDAQYGLVITQTGGTSDPSVKTYSVKPVIDSYGFINKFRLEEPIETDLINVGDIVSFGFIDSVITDCVVFGKKDDGNDTFTLTLVPYLEEIYNADTGEIPEFDSKVTRRLNGSEYTSPSASYEDLYNVSDTAHSELTTEIENVKTEISNSVVSSTVAPSDVSSCSGIAEKDGIQLSAVAGGSTIYDNVKNFVYEISRDAGTSWESVTGSYYSFDRTKDLYPEKSAFVNYRVRAKALSSYGLKSSNWTEGTVTASSSYGTWILSAPTVTAKATENKIEIAINDENNSGVWGFKKYSLASSSTKGALNKVDDWNYTLDITGLYLEKSDIESIVFTAKVETEASSATATCVADTGEYLTYVPSLPTVSYYINGRGLNVSFGHTDFYEFSNYELQISQDGTNWYSFGSNDTSRTDETVWKGTLNADTDITGKSWGATLALSGETKNLPTDTTYYFRARTKGYSDAIVSDWTSAQSLTATATHANDVAENTVTSAHIKANAIIEEKLADSAITETKIADNSISTSKIQADAITADLISAGAITTDLIEAGAVVSDKISVDNLSAISSTLGDVVAGSIASSSKTESGSTVQAPENSSLYLNSKSGQEEFYIGNVAKGEFIEGKSGHEALWFKTLTDGTKTILFQISNFIVTSISSIIRGLFKVQDKSGNTFISANPYDSVQTGDSDNTPAKTVTVGGYLTVQNELTASYLTVNNDSTVNNLTVNNDLLNPGTGGEDSFKAGRRAVADGSHSVAIGGVALATGQDSVTIGGQAKGDYSITLKGFTSETGKGSVAIGYNSNANGEKSVAIGYETSNLNIKKTTSLGAFATARGEGAVALGYDTTASGENSIAIGYGATATEANTAVFASGLTVKADSANIPTITAINATMSGTTKTATLNVTGNATVSGALTSGGITVMKATQGYYYSTGNSTSSTTYALLASVSASSMGNNDISSRFTLLVSTISNTNKKIDIWINARWSSVTLNFCTLKIERIDGITNVEDMINHIHLRYTYTAEATMQIWLYIDTAILDSSWGSVTLIGREGSVVDFGRYIANDGSNWTYYKTSSAVTSMNGASEAAKVYQTTRLGDVTTTALTATGATTLNSTLGVTGNATLSGGCTIGGRSAISGETSTDTSGNLILNLYTN